MANHFNDKHTPEDEFKHQFFAEWDNSEWQRFDNYMIRCIQYYLKNGLVESDKVNLDFRKLKNNVGTEFMEFMEGLDLTDLIVSKKGLRDDFSNQYKHLAKYNTAQRFNKKIKDYCDYYSINIEERQYNGVRSFIISKESIAENKEETEDEIQF